jgi:hypothetical protein
MCRVCTPSKLVIAVTVSGKHTHNQQEALIITNDHFLSIAPNTSSM